MQGSHKHSPYTGISKFIATSGVLRLFSDGKEAKVFVPVVLLNCPTDTAPPPTPPNLISQLIKVMDTCFLDLVT